MCPAAQSAVREKCRWEGSCREKSEKAAKGIERKEIDKCNSNSIHHYHHPFIHSTHTTITPLSSPST